MHELSVMSQVVETIKLEAESRKALSVGEVVLEVGELTFLSEEGLLFAYGVLIKGSVLEGSRLRVLHEPASVKCAGCAFSGPPNRRGDDGADHLRPPVLACPRCGGRIEIVSGRGCMIKTVELELPDDPGAPPAAPEGA